MQDIFRRVASGNWKIRGLCTHLNKVGVDPVYGDGWYSSRLTPLLRNPVYYYGSTVWNKNSHGRHQEFRDGEFIQPEWVHGKKPKSGRKHDEQDWTWAEKQSEAIIEKATWDEVQKFLDGNTKGVANAPRSETLYLAGLPHCGRCGERMVGRAQFGAGYVCQSYIRLGNENPFGCQLHKVEQTDLEAVITDYLGDAADRLSAIQAGDVKAWEQAGERIGSTENRLFSTLERMREYLRSRGKYRKDTETEGKGPGLLAVYTETFAADTEKNRQQFAEAEAERERLVIQFSKMATLSEAAQKPILKLIQEADEKCNRLKAELAPLTEQLEAIETDLAKLDADLERAREVMATDSVRERSGAIRAVISKIVIHFEHYDHKVTDPRSKNKGGTVRRYRQKTAEIVPVVGDARRVLFTDSTPERG